MNIVAFKLKKKPFPNNIQKKGVNVTLFSDKKNENEQDMENVEEVEETNEEKEDKEEKEETIQKIK